MTVDGEDLVRQFGQQSSLISGARTNLKHTINRADFGGLEHGRNDVGLRSGLALSDADGMVTIRLSQILLSDELMARHLGHGIENPLVADTAPAQLFFDH